MLPQLGNAPKLSKAAQLAADRLAERKQFCQHWGLRFDATPFAVLAELDSFKPDVGVAITALRQAVLRVAEEWRAPAERRDEWNRLKGRFRQYNERLRPYFWAKVITERIRVASGTAHLEFCAQAARCFAGSEAISHAERG